MNKKNIFAPLALGLGATRRAAMMLLVMLLTMAQTAWAQSGSCGDDLTWELTQHEYDDFYTLTISGTGAMADYSDSSKQPWKDYRSSIKTVVIGAGVTSIGKYTFYGCTSLTSINIPASVTSIGNYTFSKCSGLTSIEIPASVTSIGDNAFWECSNLATVTFAEDSQLASIGGSAFDNTGLTSIEIPASVTSIGNYVFYATGLTSIEIPASVTSIGVSAFASCSNLEAIIVDGGNTVYDSRNGCNAIIEKSSNTLIAGCKNTTIPDGVTSIGRYAFYGCTGLTSINIPAGVTSIGMRAFYGCTGLTSIEIPAGVTSIGIYAFEGCSGLASIDIPASVTSIGMGAFAACTGLATVTVYAPSCTLLNSAFYKCTNLTNIYVFSDYVEHYQAAENWSTYAGKITALPTVTTLYVDATGTLHEGVEAIPLNNVMTTLPAGTYVVNSDVAYTGTVTLDGDVTLILGDDCTLSFGKDEQLYATIIECNNHNLTIYGQSGGTGWLKAYSALYDGIKAVYDYKQYSGNVFIRHLGAYCIDANNSVALLGGTLDVESGGILQGDISGRYISILGGKLWARNNGLWGSRGITLGYTNATDQIYVNIYNAGGGLEIADGKTLVDDYGVIWSGALDNNQIENGINGRTLKPLIYTGVTLTKDSYDYDNVSATFSGSSETTVSIPVDITVNSVTLNRTFTYNKCATLMLPFSLGDGQSLNGGTLYKFDGVNNGEGDWVATLSESTSPLKANTPYLIYPNGHMTDDKITFDLNGGTVTLNTTTAGEDSNEKDDLWDFIGTYSYIKWTSDTGDQDYSAEREAEIGKVYGFAAVEKTGIHVGDFVRVASGAKIRPMCAYLKWKGSIPNNARALTRGAANDDTELPQRITVKLVSASGETTAIGTLDTTTGEVSFDSEAWYTLDGVRLSGKPTKKGLYINNGKKIVIR